jgi:putative holliday junction resolvase
VPKKTKNKIDEAYLMGIDYGEKNLGLALGRAGYVAPLKVIDAKHTQTAFHEIMRIALQNKVVAFVIGLPLNADGKDTKKSLEVRKFANRLKIFSKKPVHYQNEYASTIMAIDEMVDFDISQKKRNTKDHFAAALILKQFYNENS